MCTAAVSLTLSRLKPGTKRVAVAHLAPPAADQVDLHLRHARDLGVPVANELDVLVNAVRLDVVEHDRVHVLAAREHLAEAALELAVELAALGRAVAEVRER